ncbi:hypothetical protein OG946_12300 [Streptomyces sp. NBC_01808]|nr:hypothetical protein [Streptomyces sp. NBC_01808]WSA38086.1 hypothetical protein OG946_12300 [Streptomyces sp. NBC_01808]
MTVDGGRRTHESPETRTRASGPRSAAAAAAGHTVPRGELC